MALIIGGKPLTLGKPVQQEQKQETKETQIVSVIQQEPIRQAEAEQVIINSEDVIEANKLDLAIDQKLLELIDKLESNIPDIRMEMVMIHKALAKDPAQVTILTPEQTAAIFQGYSKLSNIELVQAAAKKRGSKSAQTSIEAFE